MVVGWGWRSTVLPTSAPSVPGGAESARADTNPSIGPTSGWGLLQPWLSQPEEEARPPPQVRWPGESRSLGVALSAARDGAQCARAGTGEIRGNAQGPTGQSGEVIGSTLTPPRPARIPSPSQVALNFPS